MFRPLDLRYSPWKMRISEVNIAEDAFRVCVHRPIHRLHLLDVIAPIHSDIRSMDERDLTKTHHPIRMEGRVVSEREGEGVGACVEKATKEAILAIDFSSG